MNINLKNLVEQYPCSGILHIGASTLQELPLYQILGVHNRVWVDCNASQVVQMSFDNPNELILAYSISDKIQSLKEYSASNNGESTSLLKPKSHIEKYPEIKFCDSISHTTVTLEILLDYFKKNLRYRDELNYLVLDIQGMELRALKGLGEYKTHFDVIITEAYLEELYEGCGMLSEIDEFLTDYQRVEFGEEIGKGWGDAAYVRKDLLK